MSKGGEEAAYGVRLLKLYQLPCFEIRFSSHDRLPDVSKILSDQMLPLKGTVYLRRI